MEPNTKIEAKNPETEVEHPETELVTDETATEIETEKPATEAVKAASETVKIDSETAKRMMEAQKLAIATAGKVLNLYKDLDEVVLSFKTIKSALEDVQKHQVDHSVESSDLVGNMYTHVLHALDAYLRSSQAIYEWSSLSASLLTTYTKLFNGLNAEKSQGQKTLLQNVFEHGVQKTNTSLDELQSCSEHFSQAADKLAILIDRLEIEFDEKSEYFESKLEQSRVKPGFWEIFSSAIKGTLHSLSKKPKNEKELVEKLKHTLDTVKKFYVDFKTTISQAVDGIEEIRDKLQDAVRVIEDLKTQFDEVIPAEFVENEIRDTIIESTYNLIAKCSEYRQRHTK